MRFLRCCAVLASYCLFESWHHASRSMHHNGLPWRLWAPVMRKLEALCIWRLHAVEGRLGRPLSEAPEFWRAAPEAALQWSAEDFGFPDPLWSDAPGGTPDEDYGRSAVGHLHAAGLRL